MSNIGGHIKAVHFVIHYYSKWSLHLILLYERRYITLNRVQFVSKKARIEGKEKKRRKKRKKIEKRKKYLKRGTLYIKFSDRAIAVVADV